MKELKKLLLFLMLCSLHSAYGQSNKIEYGVHLGTNRTFHKSIDDYHKLYNPNFGFSTGLIFQYNLSDKFSLRSGLSYDLKTRRNIFESPNAFYLDPNGQLEQVPSFKADINDSYLTIPVLAQYNFGKNRMFYANLGPYFEYLLQSKVKFSDIDSNETNASYNSSLTGTNRLKLGLSAGFGAKFKLSDKFKIYAELNNQMGLEEYNSGSKEYEFRMKATSLQIGLTFRL